MKDLISKSEFAKLAGVSMPTVTGLSKKGLAPALHCGRIDIGHPLVTAYLAKRQHAATSDELETDNNADIEPFLDITLREVISGYGTDSRFKPWLDARKVMEDISHKVFSRKAKQAQHVPCSMIADRLYGAIEDSHERLMNDLPKTAAARMYSMAVAGEPVEDAEKILRAIVGKHLKATKKGMTRRLRNGQQGRSANQLREASR